MYLELREIKDPVVYSQYSDKYIFGAMPADLDKVSIYILKPYIGLFDKYFEDDPLYFRTDGKRIEFDFDNYKKEITNPFTVVKVKNQYEYDMLNLPELDSSEVSNSLSDGEDILYIGYNSDYIYASFIEPPSLSCITFDRYTGKKVTGLKETEYTSIVKGYTGGWTSPQCLITQDGYLFVIYKKHYKLYIRQLN